MRRINGNDATSTLNLQQEVKVIWQKAPHGIGADFAGATGAIAPAVKILRGRRPRGH